MNLQDIPLEGHLLFKVLFSNIKEIRNGQGKENSSINRLRQRKP